ncbi:MAG: type II toxin-antitoxin system VapC family toxin [Spirochaetaceae bacterium]|nr:type II toxin-antitoxin system VapC family toxin [Spirochaetaceae bacterium]
MYLIDTHVLLWLLSEPERLSSNAKKILQEDELCISMASLWEIAIKQSNGKLDLPFSPEELYAICLERDIQVKQILPSHLNQLKNLPKIHNDPFDRLIICQSIAENIPIITHDSKIPLYHVKTVW